MSARRMAAALGASAFVAGCSVGGPTPTPAPASGGTVTIGYWRSPSSLLDAGVTASDSFAQAIAAPVQEGLLWYRPLSATQHATSAADYWSPDLATEVPTEANGDVSTSGCASQHAAMCVTWKLRQGVQWDDGSTFTSHDVCDTVRARWLEYGGAGKTNPTNVATTAGWDQVLKCTEADRYTAVLDYASLYGPYLSVGSGVYGILPASVLDKALSTNADLQKQTLTLDLRSGSGNPQAFHGSGTLDTLLDGTGPFVLRSDTSGKQIELVQNKNYWNKSASPHLDRILFIDEGDLQTEITNVLSGAVNVGFDLRLGNLAAVVHAAQQPEPLLRVDTVPESGVEKIDINLCGANGGLCDSPNASQSAYTADPMVRRAMLTAIDRSAIVDAVAPGRTSVPHDSWMYLGASYIASPNIPQTAFSRSAADAILDHAGYARDPKCGSASSGQSHRVWKDGSCIVVDLGTTSDDQVRVKIESMVQADLEAVGIRVVLKPNDPAAVFFAGYGDSGPLYTHAFDTAEYAFTSSIPGEPAVFAQSYHADCGGACPQENEIAAAGNGGGGQNVTGVADAQLDSALDKGGSSVDPAQRTASYLAAEQRLAAVLPEIPLFQQIAVNTYSTPLQGVNDNDVVWDFDTADWSCAGGNCQA